MNTALQQDVSIPEPPYLNLGDPDFSMNSAEARAARAKSWYARTNYGLAVLR